MKALPSSFLSLLFACASAVGLATPARSQIDEAPITPAVNPISARGCLLPELTRQVAQYFHATGELQLELVRPWTSPAPAGAAIDVSISEYPSVLSASMLLKVRILAAGLEPVEQTLAVRAQLFRDAWITRSPQERGLVFDSSQFDLRRVDALRERDVLYATDGDNNYVFARSVSAGRVLSWHDIARRSLVRKGDIIEVSAIDGSLSITMKALAMENGAAGDNIRVRNLESKKEFPAQVIAEARAQVRF